jgi:hypothetical protein
MSSLFCNPRSGAKDLLAGSSDDKSRLLFNYLLVLSHWFLVLRTATITVEQVQKYWRKLDFPGDSSLISES